MSRIRRGFIWTTAFGVKLLRRSRLEFDIHQHWQRLANLNWHSLPCPPPTWTMTLDYLQHAPNVQPKNNTFVGRMSHCYHWCNINCMAVKIQCTLHSCGKAAHEVPAVMFVDIQYLCTCGSMYARSIEPNLIILKCRQYLFKRLLKSIFKLWYINGLRLDCLHCAKVFTKLQYTVNHVTAMLLAGVLLWINIFYL